MMTRDHAWPLWPLPLACSALMLLASHGSWLLAAATGHLGWCFPYGLDCHSISATGREMPAKLLFKPLLIAGATLLMLYWLILARWLRFVGVAGARPAWIAALGAAGAFCLMPYAAALGEGGDSALLLRRLGAVLGFSLNFLAQLLLADVLARQSKATSRAFRAVAAATAAESGAAPALSPAFGAPSAPGDLAVLRLSWWLLVTMLALGMASALLAPFAWHDRIDDGIEWWLALLLNLNLALTALPWRRSRYRL